MTNYYILEPALGFYDDAYGPVPKNAIPIDEKLKITLLAGLRQGKQIVINSDKTLFLAEITVPEKEKTFTISAKDFINLFTETEQEAIATACQKNSKVFRWYIKIATSTFIDLTSSDIVSGLQMLVSLNIITDTRMQQILAGDTPA